MILIYSLFKELNNFYWAIFDKSYKIQLLRVLELRANFFIHNKYLEIVLIEHPFLDIIEITSERTNFFSLLWIECGYGRKPKTLQTWDK